MGTPTRLHRGCGTPAAQPPRLRAGAMTLVMLLLLGAPAIASEHPALAKARALYNAANYEGAIDAAAVARREPQWADAAGLVMSRSYLERYRQAANPADLAAARETLLTVRSAALAPRDQVDLLIGLGQMLYLGEVFGGAAELFDTALGHADLLGEQDRLALLDWWATALDREAQARPADRRTRGFERMTTRMDAALREDPANPVANYWLVVALRGTGDLERAWDAAIAAWVRSSLSPASSERLRTDVDRLVTQALIPERARLRPQREQADAAIALRSDWDLVKQQWK